MYTVTIDLASPADAPVAPQDTEALGAELEQLVLEHVTNGALRRIETLVSPAGVIFAVSLKASSSEEAGSEVGDLITRALTGTPYARWTMVTTQVRTEPETGPGQHI